MLFGSAEFLFVLLPFVVVAYYLTRNVLNDISLTQTLMCLSSLLFIGYGGILDVAILLCSLAANWMLLHLMSLCGGRQRKVLLAVSISMNLSIIALFKYSGLICDMLNDLFGLGIPSPDLPLPLAISFYTFQLITLHVDSYRNNWPAPPKKLMVLFYSFFPHLLAGPLLWFQDVRHDLETMRPIKSDTLLPGMMLLSLGLFKKGVFADNLAPLANAHFNAIENGAAPTFIDAWGGTLAYGFQIYFDFSGYTDMAVGLALIFGIVLPVNFFSPYKARNIIDFWRYWHMSLSRFLREYLYFVLGGNRLGVPRRWANLFVTMFLGGLWHGASWNFAIWGGAHGLLLGINHTWRTTGLKIPSILAWSLTFLGVTFCWVFFRAQNIEVAMTTFSGMLGMNGFSLPSRFETLIGPLFPVFVLEHITFGGNGQIRILDILFLAMNILVVFLFPNSDQLVREKRDNRFLNGFVGPISCGILGAIGMMSIFQPAPFIYFRF